MSIIKVILVFNIFSLFNSLTMTNANAEVLLKELDGRICFDENNIDGRYYSFKYTNKPNTILVEMGKTVFGNDKNENIVQDSFESTTSLSGDSIAVEKINFKFLASINSGIIGNQLFNCFEKSAMKIMDYLNKGFSCSTQNKEVIVDLYPDQSDGFLFNGIIQTINDSGKIYKNNINFLNYLTTLTFGFPAYKYSTYQLKTSLVEGAIVLNVDRNGKNATITLANKKSYFLECNDLKVD